MADVPTQARLPWYAIVTGAVILLGFSWFTYFMVSVGMQLDQKQQFRWDRLLLIFNAVQTLTVAAAGALLGTVVQQGRDRQDQPGRRRQVRDCATARREPRSARRCPHGRAGATPASQGRVGIGCCLLP